MSIRLKLTIMFLIAALVPALLVGSLTYNNYSMASSRHLVILILAVVFILAALMAFVIVRTISKSIASVSKGARIIGSGDLNYKIGVGSKDEIGQLAASFNAMAQDLKASIALRDSERQRLYSVLETLPVYVVLLDKDYRAPFANKFFRERFGESHGKPCYEYLFKRNSPCENCETYKVLETNLPRQWQWTGPDGRDYHIYDYPFTDADGSMLILEMGIDITERKQAEKLLREVNESLERRVAERTEALARERENLQTVFDAVNIGMLLVDEEGVVKKVNNTISIWAKKAFSACCGTQPGNILGCIHALSDPKGCGYTPHCASCPIRKSFESVLRTGEPVHGVETEATLYLEEKKIPLWFEINADPLTLDRRRHAIIAMNNITLRKQAEEILKRDKETLERVVADRTRELMSVRGEIEQTRRLSDIGMLAATVAHELRNPLAAIRMAAFNIKRKAQNPVLDKHLNNIETKVSESDQIIDNLLFYSRIKASRFEPINIHNIFNACIAERKRHPFKYEAAIITDIAKIKNLLVEADALQMKEIFLNILNNAFDALPEHKGRIDIEAHADDSCVHIRIKDNGSGIDKAQLDKIFEPFFTTKAKGTGLGLSVCQQIMHLHAGSIRIESAKGKGTSVILDLPIKQDRNG